MKRMPTRSSVRGMKPQGGKRGRPDRLSVCKPIVQGMVKNLPMDQPLNEPIHPKRVRFLPEPIDLSSTSKNLLSPLDLSVPSTSRGPRTPPPMPASPGPDLMPSPALKLEYGSINKAGETDTPTIKRPLIPSSSVKPLLDDEISTKLNYGSEEESDNDEEWVTQAVIVPRAVRMFMDGEDDEVEEDHIDISLERCPPAPLHSLEAKTSASSPPASPIVPMAASPVTPLPASSTEKLNSEWSAFQIPQISFNLRRETFSQINSGPTVSFTTPYEAFTAIWDREVMELIVTETNIYAQQQTTVMLGRGTLHPQSRITRWQDTNINEIYMYLGIVLAMGVVVKSRLEEYWDTSKDIFSTPGFTTFMSYDRFLLLSKCLHFSNYYNCNIALLTRHQAKLFKIQPIIDHLNCKFSQLYNLSQDIVLDDSLTMRKGWLDINQSIRNKAATVGIKTYEVCESQTGYLWRCEVHAGPITSTPKNDDPQFGRIPSLVLRLLNGLEHKGHTVWMDKFYNSPALARKLKVLGFDCVGTLRTSRQFGLSELASISEKDMTDGEVFECISGDVNLIVWKVKNRNRVAFISTYHSVATTGSGDASKPTVAHDYNLCVSGVDRKDQQLAMYPIERRRTKVWYKKFFRRLLNVSVLNAHILLNNSRLSHRNFRKTLINALLKTHGTRTPAPTTTATASTTHSPAQYGLIKEGKSDRLKRLCAVCKKRTTTYCKACNVTMCMFTCYEPYHSSRRHSTGGR